VLSNVYQSVVHLIRVTTVEAREKVRDLANTENVRVEYILGNKSKDEMANLICRNDRLRTKWTGFLHLYELLSVVAIETFANINAGQNVTMISDQLHQLNAVRMLCNEQFQHISVAHSVAVPQWDDVWTVRRQKFSAKALRDAASDPANDAQETNIVIKIKSRRTNIKSTPKNTTQPGN
jgi:hypothetical protein